MKKTIIGRIKAATGEYDGTFVLTTEAADRDGDVIEASAWDLTNFLKNPIALWQHDHKNPVGTWENVRVETGRIVADLKLASTNLARMTKQLIEDGVLKAVSVGFIPHEYENIEDEKGQVAGWLIKKAELLEASLVSVGANQEALLISKNYGLTTDEESIVFNDAPESKSANPETLARVKTILGKSASSSNPKQANTAKEAQNMTLSERIKAKQDELVKLREELSKAANEYAEDATDENQETVQGFADNVDQTQKQLDTLMTAEKSIMEKMAEPKTAKAPGVVTTVKDYDPGELIFRMAAVKFLSYQTHKSEAEVIRNRYKHDKGLEAMAKAAAAPGDTTTTAWAASLLDEQVSGFIDLVSNNSVYGALRAGGMSLNFSGAGSIKIPSRTATKTAPGAFVGEGNPIPVKELSMTSKTLLRHKMGVIVTMTEELMDATNSQIETIVRQAILADTSKTLDSILLDATAGDAVRPAGLLNGVTTTTSAGATAAQIITDLKALIAPFETDDAGKSLVIILHPLRKLGLLTVTNSVGDFQFAEEVRGGSLMGYRLAESSNVATDAVHCVNAGEFATAYDGPNFLESNTATLHMEDTTPEALSTAGTPNVVAAPARSLYQTYTRGIRMVLPVTWAMRRDAQVSGLDTVAW